MINDNEIMRDLADDRERVRASRRYMVDEEGARYTDLSGTEWCPRCGHKILIDGDEALVCSCRTTPPAGGAGSEQSRLFPRYSFAIVTGRYKILDNRSEGSPRIKQIATADGEDEARTIVRALNTTEQHSTLIEQRDRALEALRDVGIRLHGIQLHASAGTENAYDLASDLRGIRDHVLSKITTIEQEGETR